MPLTLRAISLNDHPLTQPITARFESEGGSIGRADHNTLALPDPERHISRQHAEIRTGVDGHSIRNVGSANPIIVRGQPLARGESSRLGHRDQVRIGGYLLEVLEDDVSDGRGAVTVAAESVQAHAQGRAAAVMRRPPPPPPQFASFGPRTAPGGAAAGLADLNAPLAANNPFAELLGDCAPVPAAVPAYAPVPDPVPDVVAERARAAPSALPGSLRPTAWEAAPSSFPPPRPLPPPSRPSAPADPFADLLPPAAGVSGSSAAWAPAPPSAVRALLPDDFDPFALPAAPAPPTDRPPTAPAGAFDDLIPHAAPASIDELFSLQAGGRDPLADFLAEMPRRSADEAETAPGLPRISTDPMAMFADPSATPAPPLTAPSRADDVPELHAAFVPARLHGVPAAAGFPAHPSERVGRPTPPSGLPTPARLPAAPSPPTATASSGQADPHALWAAFCAGAGVAIDLPQGCGTEQMHVVGSLLRAAVDGTLQLMMVRATTKHELGADVTMIRARNNNPLKFSPDAASALEQLLKPPLRGFLPGPAAMTDAMHDLVGHTIGTMAGTRAALEGVLDRFRPQQLEAKLSAKSVLDSLVPMSRKAKLWELYLQHFEAIRNEAQDDFHALFGRAFLAAYQEQLARLRQSEPGRVPV